MTSSGWTRQRRCEYRQTTVQEPWGATGPRSTTGCADAPPLSSSPSASAKRQFRWGSFRDLYLWLTYRTFALNRPLRLSWRQVYRQFGVDPAKACDARTVDYFRTDCLRELQKIKRAWPNLNYRTAKGALILSPSPPAVAASQLRLVDAGVSYSRPVERVFPEGGLRAAIPGSCRLRSPVLSLGPPGRSGPADQRRPVRCSGSRAGGLNSHSGHDARALCAYRSRVAHGGACERRSPWTYRHGPAPAQPVRRRSAPRGGRRHGADVGRFLAGGADRRVASWGMDARR